MKKLELNNASKGTKIINDRADLNTGLSDRKARGQDVTTVLRDLMACPFAGIRWPWPDRCKCRLGRSS